MSAWGVVIGIITFLIISWVVARLIFLIIRRIENKKKEKFQKRDY